jgi:hypothetical protein
MLTNDRNTVNYCYFCYTIYNSAGGNCIYMSGRALHVLRAVDKAEAGRLSGAGETARKDKRNLYLANEGLLVSDSPYFKYLNM